MTAEPAAALVLPLVAALLLLSSGLVKLRVGRRARLGTHLPSLLELVLAAVLGLMVVSGGVTPGAGLGLSIVGALLAVASSVHLGRGLSAQRAFRRRTEGHRLAAHLRQATDSGVAEG